ncbi:hypothetical protein ABZ307_44315 [Streptomyces griseorubiginosus]|uniref:hypothetical protein n=1 Tax=Streptomyces griseorubiginosus TaxID=67304 RepID=UPI0033B6E2EE
MSLNELMPQRRSDVFIDDVDFVVHGWIERGHPHEPQRCDPHALTFPDRQRS